MNGNYNDKLMTSVKSLRDMCDRMERIVNDNTASDVYKTSLLIHEMQWGCANASTGITNTLNAIDNSLCSKK